MATKQPDYKILYLGADITNDISETLVDIRFQDNLEGTADTLDIRVEDRDNRWAGDWLPGEGDTLSLQYGYKGEALSAAIQFELDKLTLSSPPNTASISGIATPITKSLRQTNSFAYENTTLLGIAQQIADRHGLELVGAESIPNISFERQTQKAETDLAFLRDLAADYGCMFKIESLTQLVFFREADLEAAEPVLTLDVGKLSGYRISRSAAGTYKNCEVSYQNAESGEFIQVVIDAGGEEVPEPDDEDGAGSSASADTLRLQERVESLDVARVRAVEALRRANQSRVELSADIFGDVLISAGITVQLDGLERLSGKYLIEKASHRIANNGYTSDFDARLVIY